ncbi:hypothetical protein NUH16_003503 [Penicillium rubens]|nr:hypothetical protein NUH16_003503 [Penicillium rubens]
MYPQLDSAETIPTRARVKHASQAMPVIPSSFPPIRTVDDESPINTPVVTSLDGHWSGESTTSATFKYSLSGGVILESHSLSHELGDQQPSQTEVFGSDTMRLDTAFKVTPVLSLPSQSQYDTLETLDLYVSSDPYQSILGDSSSEAAASDAVFIQGAGSKHSTNNLPKKVVVASVSESVHSHDRESRQSITQQETELDTKTNLAYASTHATGRSPVTQEMNEQTSSFSAPATPTSQQIRGNRTMESSLSSRRLSRQGVGLILGTVFGGSVAFFCIIFLHRFFCRSARKPSENPVPPQLPVDDITVANSGFKEVSRFSVDS